MITVSIILFSLQAPHEKPKSSPPQSWPETGQIQFHDLQMRYRPELDLVLKGVDCNIAAGEKVRCLWLG